MAAKPKQFDAPTEAAGASKKVVEAVEVLERFIDSVVAAATPEQCRAGIVAYMDQDNAKRLNQPGVRDELLRRYRESWATADVVSCFYGADGLKVLGVLLRDAVDASLARVRIKDIAEPIRWPLPRPPYRPCQPYVWGDEPDCAGSSPMPPRKFVVYC